MNKKNTGFTLIEMLVVVSILAIMIAVAIPALPAMIRSQKISSSQNMIKAVLSNAQVRAATSQKYAGVRFQPTPDGRFHAVQIEQAPFEGKTTMEFQAVANSKPLALPDGMGVISLDLADSDYVPDPDLYLRDYAVSGNEVDCLENLNTFSIIFSPTGQIVSKDIKIKPRDINDKIFNHIGRVTLPKTDNRKALLCCDNPAGNWEYWADIDVDLPVDWSNYYLGDSNAGSRMPGLNYLVTNLGFGGDYRERSTTGLYLYEKDILTEAEPTLRWTEIISQHKSNLSVVEMVFNVYTGAVIKRDE